MSALTKGGLNDTIEVAGRDGKRIRLTPEHVRELQSRYNNRLIRAGDEGWNEAIQMWNGMVAKRPALVLQPTSPEEVAAAVRLARGTGILLSIKGGGHNIAGTSIAENGLTLDMSRWKTVTVDVERRLVHVGPGCLLQDVDRETQKHGLATVLGFISETGVAGLTLGGGFGYLARRFGWAVDNLEEVEIVTADGDIRTANRDHNYELFWAIRGGGGNFGVVTRFTFRVHNVGPTVYGGLIAWPFERAPEIFSTYTSLTANAPRELAVWLVLVNAPPAPFVPPEWQGKRVCAMSVCYSGDLGKTAEVLAPIHSLREPVFNLLHEQPYVELQSQLDATEPKGAHYYWKTEFLPGINDGVLTTAKELFAGCPIPGGQIGFLHLAGGINDRAWDDGAVGNRNVQFACGILGMWEPGNANAQENQRWVRNAWERIRPFSTGATYINFQTADEDEQRIRDAYGANFERLMEMKRKYDPDNIFRVNKNIPPAAK